VCRMCVCRPTRIRTYHNIHTYIHTYIHTCLHTYIHTCLHTYIHTYILNVHTCGLRTYVHRGLYISVWLHARYVNENCSLLGYYAASSGNSLPKFRETCRSHPQGFRTPPPPKKKTEERSSQLLRGGSPEITHVTHVTTRIIS